MNNMKVDDLPSEIVNQLGEEGVVLVFVDLSILQSQSYQFNENVQDFLKKQKLGFNIGEEGKEEDLQVDEVQ